MTVTTDAEDTAVIVDEPPPEPAIGKPTRRMPERQLNNLLEQERHWAELQRAVDRAEEMRMLAIIEREQKRREP